MTDGRNYSTQVRCGEPMDSIRVAYMGKGYLLEVRYVVRVPYGVVTPNVKLFSLLLHHCDFATLTNRNVNNFEDKGLPKGSRPTGWESQLDILKEWEPLCAPLFSQNNNLRKSYAECSRGHWPCHVHRSVTHVWPLKCPYRSTVIINLISMFYPSWRNHWGGYYSVRLCMSTLFPLPGKSGSWIISKELVTI